VSTGTNADAVVLRGVSRRYRVDAEQQVVALDGIDLRVARGSTVALCGPSGSGKSTLLQLVGALDQPDTGEIIVDGQPLSGLSAKALAAYRRRVGFVFQRFNLLPALTVLDNVTAPLLPYRVEFDKYARARELLERVGLAGRADALPSRLSGGQQQRIAIARALIGTPALILADEPTGNLDSHTGAGIIDLLLDTRERDAVTVLLATHDISVARRCDRVVSLADGRVVADVEAADAEALAAAFGSSPPPEA
jgi:putative ABC transport system ATP-binding protein